MIYLLPALTGLLLAASFPRASQGFLAWIAFVPVILFLSQARSVTGAFVGGFIAGFLESFLLLIWVPLVLTRYGGLSGALAWFAYTLMIVMLACYPAAVCALTKYACKRCGDAFILAFPFVWVLFEFLQSFSPFGGFPWLLAGYSQSRFLSLIQVSDITGVYGISFILVWTNAAIVLLFRRQGRRIPDCIPAGVAIVLISACLIYGRVELRKWGGLHPPFKVAMLQGNISFDDSERVLRDKFQDGYVRMADRLSPSDLLILPESPSPMNFESDSNYRRTLEFLAGRFPLGMVFNNVTYRGPEQNRQYFNSAYFLDRNGTLAGVYDKMHLVPFGEYIPLKELFSFMNTVSKDEDFFSPGSDYLVVTIGGHPANAIICFEAVFPRLVRGFVQRGSRLIINLTNDGWYGRQRCSLPAPRNCTVPGGGKPEVSAAGHELRHLSIGRTYRPYSGPTGILRQAICEGRFDFIGSDTLYTRYGDVFVLLCAIIPCGLAIWAGLHKRSIHKLRT